MADDLHPYDGRERRLRDADADPGQRARGRALAARLLGMTEETPLEGLRYDLSFYSGGIGVLDRLHVAIPCPPADAARLAEGAGLIAVKTLDPGAREALDGLVRGEQPERPLPAALAAFLDDHRRAFQPRPGADTRVWCWPGSDVNAWTLMYATGGALAVIAYDQG